MDFRLTIRIERRIFLFNAISNDHTRNHRPRADYCMRDTVSACAFVLVFCILLHVESRAILVPLLFCVGALVLIFGSLAFCRVGTRVCVCGIRACSVREGVSRGWIVAARAGLWPGWWFSGLTELNGGSTAIPKRRYQRCIQAPIRTEQNLRKHPPRFPSPELPNSEASLPWAPASASW